MADLIGRCAWLSLFCEVLPRALLSELKLSRMLLGSSSAEQFLLVLAEEDISRANEFLDRAADAISELSWRYFASGLGEHGKPGRLAGRQKTSG